MPFKPRVEWYSAYYIKILQQVWRQFFIYHLSQRLKYLQGLGYRIEHKLKIKFDGHNDKFEKYSGKCDLVTDDEILYGYKLSSLCYDFQKQYSSVFTTTELSLIKFKVQTQVRISNKTAYRIFRCFHAREPVAADDYFWFLSTKNRYCLKLQIQRLQEGGLVN